MKFRPLHSGRRIRIVQPAYGVEPEVVSQLQHVLSARGLTLDAAASTEGFGKLSAGDAERAKELVAAFTDPEVGAILIGHGGYGCLRLLDRLDWTGIAANPKPIVGFSDATALLVPLSARIGPNAVHGPNARSLLRQSDETTLTALTAVLAADWATYNGVLASQAARTTCLRPGQTRGRLLGGNLSLLAALCGTPFAVDTTDAILFLEEWNEPQYRFDRMVSQLKLAGTFDRVAGLVLGDFLDITRVGVDLPEEMEQRILDLVPDQVPVLGRFPAGHGPTNLPLLQGATYALQETTLRLVTES